MDSPLLQEWRHWQFSFWKIMFAPNFCLEIQCFPNHSSVGKWSGKLQSSPSKVFLSWTFISASHKKCELFWYIHSKHNKSKIKKTANIWSECFPCILLRNELPLFATCNIATTSVCGLPDSTSICCQNFSWLLIYKRADALILEPSGKIMAWDFHNLQFFIFDLAVQKFHKSWNSLQPF